MLYRATTRIIMGKRNEKAKDKDEESADLSGCISGNVIEYWCCFSLCVNQNHNVTRRAVGGEHVPPTKVFRRLTASMNETIIKPCVAAAVGCKIILKPRLAAATDTYTSDFFDVKFRVAWLIR